LGHSHPAAISWLNLSSLKRGQTCIYCRGKGPKLHWNSHCVVARTLAQQLGIPLFAISTLASVVWTHYLDGATLRKKPASAVELPAQRGQAFAAIYQVNPAGSGLIQLLPDTVMTTKHGNKPLASWSTPYHLIQAPAGLGKFALAIELAYLDLQQENALIGQRRPFYGQHPVDN